VSNYYLGRGFQQGTSNFNDRFKNKMNHLSRSDFCLADFKVIGHERAICSMLYDIQVGNPKKQEIVGWFEKNIPEVTANVDSAKLYKKKGAFTVFVGMKTETMPVTAAAENGLTEIVAGLRFINQDMGEAWNVDKDMNGVPVLTKVVDEDMDLILQERKKRMATAKTILTTASVDQVVGNLTDVHPGDEVQVFYNDKQVKGKVTKVDPVLKTVQVDAEGENIMVSSYAVTKIYSQKAVENANQSKQENYYKTLFGPDYGEKLTN